MFSFVKFFSCFVNIIGSFSAGSFRKRTQIINNYLIVMSIYAASLFDLEYGRWVEEHSKLIFQLRAALNEQMADNQLQAFVNGAMAQHDELLSLKGAIARADIFHLLCGVWATPAERCFLWLGGFRPSEAIKVYIYIYGCQTLNYYIAAEPIKTYSLRFLIQYIFHNSSYLKYFCANA